MVSAVNIWWYSLWWKFLKHPFYGYYQVLLLQFLLYRNVAWMNRSVLGGNFCNFSNTDNQCIESCLVGDWRRRRVLGKFTGKLQVIIILGKFCEIVNCTEIFCFQYARNSWCNLTYDKLFSGLQFFVCEKNPLLTFTYTYTITAFE